MGASSQAAGVFDTFDTPPQRSFSHARKGSKTVTASPAAAFIPRFGAATYNSNGLSAHSSTVTGRSRSRRIGANVRQLTSKFGVVGLQETKLPARECNYLHFLAPVGSIVYYSNLTETSAGTALIISPSLAKQYDFIQLQLPPSLRGHVVAAWGSRRGRPPILLVNVYLSTGTNHFDKKTAQLRALACLPTTRYTVVMGDFNFLADPGDTTSSSNYHDHPPDFRCAWDTFVARHSLTELSQGAHTYFKVCAKLEQSHSSRLDRIYTSFGAAALELLKPSAILPHLPYSVLNVYGAEQLEDVIGLGSQSDGSALRLRRALSGSDHLAVAMLLPLPSKGGPPPVSPPTWVASDSRLLKLFEKRWASHSKELDTTDVFEARRLFDECYREAGFEVARLARNERAAYANKALEITAGMGLLSAATGDTSRLHGLRLKHPALGGLLTRNHDGSWDTYDLQRHLDSIIAEQRTDDTVDPDAGPPIIGKGSDVLQNMKRDLPDSRQRLSGLRRNLDEEITQEPALMADIAKGFWGEKVWAKDPLLTTKAARAFFRDTDYRKRKLARMGRAPDSNVIPFNLIPRIPDLQVIQELIMDTNNSCPGPDGIPFAAYRTLSRYYAPLVQRTLRKMAAGAVPPEGFNHGLLFLIPKKGTCLPEDTRPISVTNAGNRILASVVVAAITPALQDVLHPSQKGFVEGRRGEDHIVDLNREFYSRLNRDAQYHILMMDTAKAFDSVSHEFVLEALRQLDMPPWVVTTVSGLLHSARVTPCFGSDHGVMIDILRGVKQGCPLSPLLFAICYDSLLEALVCLPGITPFAYADDLALGTTAAKHLPAAMTLVDAFRAASGLGVNVDKTAIISTRRGATLETVIAASPWPDVRLADDHLYLGVLMGPEVTLDGIFARPLERMKARVSACLATVRTMSRVKRVLFFNIFVFSSLRYLIDFFPLPYGKGTSAEAQVQRLARLCAIRFNGTAYSYCHLVQPPTKFGPSPPVWDGWGLSVASLASRGDLGRYSGLTVIPRIKYNDSVLISDLAQSHAAEFAAYDLSTRPDDVAFDASLYVQPTRKARAAAMYKKLMSVAYAYDQQDPDIEAKLRAREVANCGVAVNFLHEHYALLPRTFPSYSRSTQFDIVFNALATSHRYNATLYGNKETRLQRADACYFCQGHKDTATHIFGERTVVQEALKLYGAALNLTFTPDQAHAPSVYGLHVLAFPPTTSDYTQSLVTFNSSVWRERCTFFKSVSPPIGREAAAKRIARVAGLDKLTSDSPKGSRYGSAGSRSDKQKAAARAYARRLIESVPEGDIICYTDGSALDNPGPAGAGCLVVLPGGKTIEGFTALGDGTNNRGELWAAGAALRLVKEAKNNDASLANANVHIFTDSQYTVGVVRDFWKPTNDINLRIARAVRALCPDPTQYSVHFRWIPAHVGVDGNEHADFLANLGSAASKAGKGLSASELEGRINRSEF